MKIWAVANQKGGVGKTTTSVSLAGWLVAKGLRTLLLDLDPHASLTAYFKYQPDNIEDGAYALFRDSKTDVRQLVLRTDFDGLDLIPSSLALATVDRQLGNQEGMGLVISRALHRVSTIFDVVIIDCPPMLGVPMVNALAAASRLIIPVQTEHLALQGLARMVRTLQMVTQARKNPLPYVVVPTMYDRRTRAAGLSLAYLQDHYGEHLSHTLIPIDTQFREASRRGVPLPLSLPRSRGSQAYEMLVEELLRPASTERSAVA